MWFLHSRQTWHVRGCQAGQGTLLSTFSPTVKEPRRSMLTLRASKRNNTKREACQTEISLRGRTFTHLKNISSTDAVNQEKQLKRTVKNHAVNKRINYRHRPDGASTLFSLGIIGLVASWGLWMAIQKARGCLGPIDFELLMRSKWTFNCSLNN